MVYFIKDTQLIEVENIDEIRENILTSQGYVKYSEIPQSYYDDVEKAEAEKTNNEAISEAKQYLNATGWIWEKYSRNVLVLKDVTEEEFRTKYADIIEKQEQCRSLLNG